MRYDSLVAVGAALGLQPAQVDALIEGHEPGPIPPGGSSSRPPSPPTDPLEDLDAHDRTPEEAGGVLKEIRVERGIEPDAIPGVSLATVTKIERGAVSGLRPNALTSYLDTIGCVAEAFDWLRVGAPPDEVRLENQEPEIQIAAAAGKLDPEGQADVMAFIQDLLTKRKPD